MQTLQILLSLSWAVVSSSRIVRTDNNPKEASWHSLRSHVPDTSAIASLPVTSPSSGEDWSEVASDAPFGGKCRHSSVVFSDAMWLIGGLSDGNENMNDVWSSPDGSVWTLVTSSAKWSKRRDHASVVFKDKMWVIGGYGDKHLNDIWSSWDGISWTAISSSAAWSGRSGHTCVVFQDKLWVIGGDDGSGTSAANDIWSSTDGSLWSLAAVAPWGKRSYHTSIVNNGRIWVIGGASDGSRDVWSSDNGTFWSFVADPDSVARTGHTSVVYNGLMWVIGGGHTSEVLSSADGVTWNLISPSAQWKSRDFHSSFVYFNLMWVIGGMTGLNRAVDDVWTSLPPEADDVLFALHYGDAFSITLLLGMFVVGALYGYGMDFVRRRLRSVVPLSVGYVQNPLLVAFAAGGWISTLLTALDMMESGENHVQYGVCIILGLLFPALIALSISLSILLSLLTRVDCLRLTPYLDGHVVVEKGLCVISLACVSIMDPTLLAFLPWKMSDFAANSDGIPCMWMFRLLMYQEAIFAAYICVIILFTPMHMTFVSTSAFILNGVGLLVTVTNIIFKLQVKKIQQYNSVVVTGHLFASEAVVSLMHFRAKDVYAQLDDDPNGFIVEQPSISRELTASIDSEATKQRLKELAALKDEIEELRRREEEEKRLAALRNPYADEDVEVLELQLKAHNIQAARYIPLPVLKSELSVIMSNMQNGQPFDERRLDYLFRCLAFNKDYIAEQQEEHRLWQESVSALTHEYLQQQRAFVPSDIFSVSLDTLVSRGMPIALAKRLLNKKCLWLLRMSETTISTLHEADLMGRYNPQGQNLDIVELLAVYAACPCKFELDSTGKKETWRSALEESVKAIMKQQKDKGLPAAKLRNPVYKGQLGLFPDNEMYTPDTLSKDHFGEKDPFLSQPPHRIPKGELQLPVPASKEHVEDKDHDHFVACPPRHIQKGAILKPFKVSDSVVNILHQSQKEDNLL